MSLPPDLGELSDSKLYEKYQQLKSEGPVILIDEVQAEIAKRWECRRGDRKVTIDDSGAYLNVFVNDELRVSISESHDELLVYAPGVDEPVTNLPLDPNS